MAFEGVYGVRRPNCGRLIAFAKATAVKKVGTRFRPQAGTIPGPT